MKLLESEIEILSVISTRANASIREIAKLTGIREHRCRYILGTLFRRGVITRRAVINPGRLGYQCYAVWFSLPSVLESQQASILDSIIHCDHVSYLGEYSGEYEWRIDILARSANHADRILGKLGEKHNGLFSHCSFSCSLSIADYSLRSFSKRANSSTALVVDFGVESVETSVLDRHILRELAADGSLSVAALSRRLHTPEASINYRLKKLEESGIIVGFHTLVAADNARSYELSLYLHRICLSAWDPVTRKRVQLFAEKNPSVHGLTQMLGDCEVEILSAAMLPKNERQFEQQMKSTLSDVMTSVRTQTALKHHKVNSFPFSKERTQS